MTHTLSRDTSWYQKMHSVGELTPVRVCEEWRDHITPICVGTGGHRRKSGPQEEPLMAVNPDASQSGYDAAEKRVTMEVLSLFLAPSTEPGTGEWLLE